MGTRMIQLLLMLLPWSLRRALLRRLCGFEIGPGATIGFALVRAERVSLGPNARIGHLTLVKGLDAIILAESARVGPLNWITGFPSGNRASFTHVVDRTPVLVVGEHSAITGRHYIDCTGGFFIGRFSTFAGWGSQVVSHSIDLPSNRQDAAPIRVGDYSFVGTRSVLLKGSALPDYSVLAAGSVLSKHFDEPFSLISGVPATRVRALSPDLAYFKRSVGMVS